MKYTEKLNVALQAAISSRFPGLITIDRDGFALKFKEISGGVEKKRVRSGRADVRVKYVTRFQKSWNELVKNGCVIRQARIEKDGYILRFKKADGTKARRIEGSFLRGRENFIPKKCDAFTGTR